MPTNVGCQNMNKFKVMEFLSVAAQQTFPSVTLRLPPSPLTGFTVTGTGTENSASIERDPPLPPGLMISMNFRLFISEGTANRTYFIRASDSNSVPGELTDGSTPRMETLLL
jgi:hypothetical protein